MLPQRDAAYRCSPTRPHPIFHHVGLDAGRPNSKPETDQLAVPEEVLGSARLGCVNGPFCDALPHVHVLLSGTTQEPPRSHSRERPSTTVPLKRPHHKRFLNRTAKWGMMGNVTRPDSKSGGLTPVLVRVRPGAPIALQADLRDENAGRGHRTVAA